LRSHEPTIKPIQRWRKRSLVTGIRDSFFAGLVTGSGMAWLNLHWLLTPWDSSTLCEREEDRKRRLKMTQTPGQKLSSQHYDNLATACIAKATALEEAADKYGNEKFRERAAEERKEAILYIEMAKGLSAHA
jgi:hypothetical protein